MSSERPRISMQPIEAISQEARVAFSSRYGIELTTRNFRRAVKEMLFSMTEAAMMHALETRGEVPFQGKGDVSRGCLEGSDIHREIRESRSGAVAYLHPDGKDPINHYYSFPLREPVLAFSGSRFQGERYNAIMQALEVGDVEPLQSEFSQTLDLLNVISGNQLSFLKPYFLHYDPQELIIAGKYPARYARADGERPAVTMTNEQSKMLLDVLGIKSWKNFVQMHGEKFKTLPFEAAGAVAIEIQELAKNVGLTINPDLFNNPDSIAGFIRQHIGDDYEGYGFTFLSYYALTALFPNLNQHARMAIAAIVSNAYIAAVELNVIKAPIPQTPDAWDISGGVFGSLLFVATHYALTTYFNRKEQRQSQQGQLRGQLSEEADLLDDMGEE